MKIKLRITMTDIVEVDVEDYDAETPQGVAKEQQAYFDKGAADPGELVGFGGAYSVVVEVAK